MADLFGPFRARPGEAGLCTDFDGTLSAIVEDPAAASPVPAAAGLLERLAHRLGLVAVLSGRPVSFLEPLVPPGVQISGLYGLERSKDGRRLDHPQAGAWREVIDDVATAAVANGPAGMGVERKGLSLTLHYRTAPDLADAVTVWAERQATRSGLRVRPARMSTELHPPIDADKGTALTELVDGLSAVCYCGDDRGDLPAFDALDRLAARHVHTVRVAVASAETPAELVDRADVVVPDPEAVADLLATLL